MTSRLLWSLPTGRTERLRGEHAPKGMEPVYIQPSAMYRVRSKVMGVQGTGPTPRAGPLGTLAVGCCLDTSVSGFSVAPLHTARFSFPFSCCGCVTSLQVGVVFGCGRRCAIRWKGSAKSGGSLSNIFGIGATFWRIHPSSRNQIFRTGTQLRLQYLHIHDGSSVDTIDSSLDV